MKSNQNAGISAPTQQVPPRAGDAARPTGVENELASLQDAAAKLPGVQDLLAIYARFQHADAIAGSVRRAMQPARFSPVSDGSYPSLKF